MDIRILSIGEAKFSTKTRPCLEVQLVDKKSLEHRVFIAHPIHPLASQQNSQNFISHLPGPSMHYGYRGPPWSLGTTRISRGLDRKLNLRCSCGDIIRNNNGRLLTEFILVSLIRNGMPPMFFFVLNHLLDARINCSAYWKLIWREANYMVHFSMMIESLPTRMVCGLCEREPRGLMENRW